MSRRVIEERRVFVEEVDISDDGSDVAQGDEVPVDLGEEPDSSTDEKDVAEKDEPESRPALTSGPSGTNVSADRNFTIREGVPPVLYQLEWLDRGIRKPSFYSSTPFTNLTIVKDTVSKRYQAPGTGSYEKPAQPVIEIVTRINGTAERDKAVPLQYGPPGAVGGPPPPPPHPATFPLKKTKKIAQPKPYKLDEIAFTSLGSTRIMVHSPHLLRALRSIISYYPLQKIPEIRIATFSHPYMALIHHRDALVDFAKNGNDEYNPTDVVPTSTDHDDKQQDDPKKMMEHMKVLLDYFDPLYHTFMEKIGDRLTKLVPMVTFQDLWYLFPPGTDVYLEGDEDKTLAAVVLGCRYDGDYELDIKCWFLTFDGKELRRRSNTITISSFTGEREITSLSIYPARVWDIKDGGRRRKSFETRGETIFKLCQGRHKQAYYNGPDDEGDLFKGLVIIDNDPIKNLDFHDKTDDGPASSMAYSSASSGSEREDRRTRRRKKVDTPNKLAVTRGSDPGDEVSSSSYVSSYDSDRPTPKKAKKAAEFKWVKYNNLTVSSTLTKHHFMLIHPFIMGFAVLSKKWRVFDIDYISKVPQREDMIDNVVMESAKQQIIKAISHTQNHAWKLDFIQGKGEGQIVLLHGPPGVGKTYTVECAAEATGRPLIFLTIADIGLDEKRIEDQMTKWFSLAERWEAILLIDEADIFLERRRGADIARNSLVSVFLRKMEYFQGLLFLTTNRIGQIDDAFLSRIHVVIGYTPLTEEQRATIWKGFFKKLEHDMKLVSAQHARNRQSSKDGRKHERDRDNKAGKKDEREKSKSREKEKKEKDGKDKGKEEKKQPERLVKIQVSRYAKEYVLNDPEVRALKWNGREIRNAFQTAISLAGFEAAQEDAAAAVESDNSERSDDDDEDTRRRSKSGRKDDADKLREVVVDKEHFISVVRMSREFHSYMNSISLQEEGERARGRLERNDAFVAGGAGGGGSADVGGGLY